MKPCSRCGTEHTNKHSYCRSCRNEYSRQYKRKNYSKKPAYKHDMRMRQKAAHYGLAEEQIQALLNEQLGCCAICGKDFGTASRPYHIDHDHTTEAVRGLLCNTCNTLMGCVDKRQVDPRRIAAYLKGR